MSPLNLWQWVKVSIFEDATSGATKFAALDGLRGLAVLAVFVSHTSGFDQRLAPWLNFRMIGHTGVYLFFVLSGFMLAYGLLRRDSMPFFRFLLRRFFRIAPLYYLVITGVFGLQLLLQRDEIFNLRVNGGFPGYLRHLLFFQGDSVFWTIAAEFEFYFLLPFLALLLLRFGWRAFTCLSALAVLYGGWALLVTFEVLPEAWAPKVARIAHDSQYFDVFLCGVLAAFLMRDRSAREWLFVRRAQGGVIGWVFLGGSAALTFSLVAKKVLFFDQYWVEFRHLSLVYGFAFAIIILASLLSTGALAAFLSHPLLRIIGVTCFSWYLLHFLIIGSVNAAFGHIWVPRTPPEWTGMEIVRFGLSLGLTFVISIVSYLLIEKPFMMASRNIMVRERTASVSA